MSHCEMLFFPKGILPVVALYTLHEWQPLLLLAGTNLLPSGLLIDLVKQNQPRYTEPQQKKNWTTRKEKQGGDQKATT